MNWDDLRYILAVARAGTIVAGARVLRVSPSTMSRRLRALEQTQGAALFEKFKHGTVLTDAGHRMVAVAETVEQLAGELDAELHGLDTRLAGIVRVTSTDMLLRHWLADLGGFQQRYPDIELELISSRTVANMTLREADVAVRVTMRPPDHLVGRRFASFAFSVYGSRELVADIGADAPYDHYRWLAWDTAIDRSTDQWLAEQAPKARIAMRFARMNVMCDAVQQGLGVTLLPCLLGDSRPELTRIGTYCARPGVHLWMLTHPQLRGAARIRAFLDAMTTAIERDRDLIEGKRPKSPRKGATSPRSIAATAKDHL